MTKAQKTKGASFWVGKNVYTTYSQKIKIIDNILGIDLLGDKKNRKIAEEIMVKIRVIIGQYEGAVESIDKKPRAANYLAELNGTKKNSDGTIKSGLRRQAFDLSESLADMSYLMRDEYKTHDYDLYEFHRHLARFLSTCAKIVDKYEGDTSSGRPKNTALKMVVNSLNSVFDKYYAVPALDENDQENDRRRNAIQESRIKFIRECLSLDLIPCPETDSALLQLLYTDITPPQERLVFRSF
jgi:hypothetical protein